MKGKKMSMTTKILVGLILGVIVGFFFMGSPDIAETYIKPNQNDHRTAGTELTRCRHSQCR